MAQPSEPILFPKLRIYFADFPYLHFSIEPEAVHLGDLLRIFSTHQHEIVNVTEIFKGRPRRSRHRHSCSALRIVGPYLRLTRFQGFPS